MIYFTAVNSIKKDSKYFQEILNKKDVLDTLIWGITELSNSTFKRIKNGDYICFYYKFNIIGISKVVETKIDKNVSDKIFGSYNHNFKGVTYWSNLLYLTNFKNVNVPFDFFIKLGNYSPKFSVRKLIGINQKSTDEIFKKFKSFDDFITETIKENGTQQCI